MRNRWYLSFVLSLLFMFCCRHTADQAHPLFKKQFDEQALVYEKLLSSGTFTPQEQRTILSQLPVAQLHDGDVILRLMEGASSLLTSFSSLGGYSHVGILRRMGDSVFVIDCQPHNAVKMGEHCIKKHSLAAWVTDVSFNNEVSRVLTVLVMRCTVPFSGARLRERVDSLLCGCVQFDGKFELNNDQPDCRRLYCSEFVYDLFKPLLGDREFIFFSDPITNTMIDYAMQLEKENRYPEFCRMLHVIEDRFHVKIRNVNHLISPSVFEWSAAFSPVCFAHHPQLKTSSYLPMIRMYAYLLRSVLYIKALHAVPVDCEREAAMAYARLEGEQKFMLRQVFKEEEKNGPMERFVTEKLICRLLTAYAESPRTYELAGKAVAKMERPAGHGQRQQSLQPAKDRQR